MVPLGLLDGKGQPVPTRKGDPHKMASASVVKSHTSVGNEWIAQRLEMGHSRSVSRMIRQGNDNPQVIKLCSLITFKPDRSLLNRSDNAYE
jgi:hypothetical protein